MEILTREELEAEYGHRWNDEDICDECGSYDWGDSYRFAFEPCPSSPWEHADIEEETLLSDWVHLDAVIHDQGGLLSAFDERDRVANRLVHLRVYGGTR